MKTLLLILILFVSITVKASDDEIYKELTKQEIKYVKSIVSMQREDALSVERNENNTLLIIFPTAKYLMDSKGYIVNVWILGDDDITWENMGQDF
jgi:hypothetical protein